MHCEAECDAVARASEPSAAVTTPSREGGGATSERRAQASKRANEPSAIQWATMRRGGRGDPYLGVGTEVVPAVFIRCHHGPEVARTAAAGLEGASWLLAAVGKGLLLDDRKPFVIHTSGNAGGVVPLRDCLAAVDDAVGVSRTGKNLRRCVPPNTRSRRHGSVSQASRRERVVLQAAHTCQRLGPCTAPPLCQASSAAV